MLPTLPEFLKLTRKGNLIPVYKEIPADLDTPVSAFLKIARGPYSFLFESVEGQEKIGRYSFLGSAPALIFESSGERITLSYPGRRQKRRFTTRRTPLDELRSLMSAYRAVEVKGLPRFFGGLVGYVGYDAVRHFERLPDKNPDDLGCPETMMMLSDTLLVFDHFNHTIKIVSNVFVPGRARSEAFKRQAYGKAVRRIERIEKEFRGNVSCLRREEPRRRQTVKVSSNVSRARYEGMVRTAKQYIRRGDIIQVVPSQRFSVRTQRDPFSIYRTLRSINPSPYMFYLRAGASTLVGASPEMLVRCEDGLVQTRPIAGTRPRGITDAEDARLAKELSKDVKERAEHLMLVDLGRNDLGRVCCSGSVTVTEFMSVEKYSHVMHLVSEVSGKLDKRRFDIYDVLKAAFPAGTVSGSPKIRAMEIIDELESTRRGPYAGCVGYFSFSHNMDTCITIRTILIRGGKAFVQAGGGVVADSKPAREYQETVNKAKALIEAITR